MSAITFSPEWDDLFYSTPEPDSQKVREFGKWLAQNRHTFITLYHGTAQYLLAMQQGLLPTSGKRAKSLQSSHGFVCLSVFPGMAKTFAELNYPSKETVVYSVNLCIRNLKPDLDQLRNQRLWAGRNVQDTLAHSLIFGHGARVKGKIDPFHLSICEDSP